MSPETRVDDLSLLLDVLSPALRERIEDSPTDELLEIVLDLGRIPQARYLEHTKALAEEPVSHAELAQVIGAVGEFGPDNRAGIEGSLHRISALRNRRGHIVGLTLRVGRTVLGTIDQIRDLVEGGLSLLLLGRPGVGKTTKLREIARVLADDFDKRVVIVDTSNEIGGDGDVPHPGIGSARRMQVPHPNAQHAVMIEAVENHMPEVIVIDEIGTAAEALAARSIAERGVQLIATAHGNTLENLVSNPTLNDLVGGVQTVTLSDEEARLRGTQKTVSERKAPPTFDAVVELLSRSTLRVHADTGRAVDLLLRGHNPGGERRGPDVPVPGSAAQTAPAPARTPWSEAGSDAGFDARFDAGPRAGSGARPEAGPLAAAGGSLRIYPYAVSRDLLERALRGLHLDARIVRQPEHAQVIVALRSRTSDPRLQGLLRATGAPLRLVKKNTTAQLRRLLQDIAAERATDDPQAEAALREAEAAAQQVLREGGQIALAPRPGAVRRLQHRVAVRHRLVAESVGSEPDRHLVIHSG